MRQGGCYACSKYIEDRASARTFARNADVVGSDAQPQLHAWSKRHSGYQKARSLEAEHDQPIAPVITADHRIKTDCRFAAPGKRRIALNDIERTGRSHGAIFHHDELIGNTLDISDVMADVDHWQWKRLPHAFEKWQDLAFGGAVAHKKRIVQQEQPRLA
ncbi:hypothetical protein ACM42_02765 [Bradyrhizobium sp. CCBAU 25338]|nr:hypothetical protein [Bradyrhizobium sp. CCBAU 45389]MDA9527372.1 hypothetical protein [Bradyrhizobium sp. CCBAU 25338]